MVNVGATSDHTNNHWYSKLESKNKKWNQLDEQTTYKQERCYRKVVKRYTAENNGRHQSSKKQKTNKLTFIVLTLQIGNKSNTAASVKRGRFGIRSVKTIKLYLKP